MPNFQELYRQLKSLYQNDTLRIVSDPLGGGRHVEQLPPTAENVGRVKLDWFVIAHHRVPSVERLGVKFLPLFVVQKAGGLFKDLTFAEAFPVTREERCAMNQLLVQSGIQTLHVPFGCRLMAYDMVRELMPLLPAGEVALTILNPPQCSYFEPELPAPAAPAPAPASGAIDGDALTASPAAADLSRHNASASSAAPVESNAHSATRSSSSSAAPTDIILVDDDDDVGPSEHLQTEAPEPMHNAIEDTADDPTASSVGEPNNREPEATATPQAAETGESVAADDCAGVGAGVGGPAAPEGDEQNGVGVGVDETAMAEPEAEAEAEAVTASLPSVFDLFDQCLYSGQFCGIERLAGGGDSEAAAAAAAPGGAKKTEKYLLVSDVGAALAEYGVTSDVLEGHLQAGGLLVQLTQEERVEFCKKNGIDSLSPNETMARIRNFRFVLQQIDEERGLSRDV